MQNGVKLSNDDIIIEVLSFFVMMPEDLEDATLLKLRAFRTSWREGKVNNSCIKDGELIDGVCLNSQQALLTMVSAK